MATTIRDILYRINTVLAHTRSETDGDLLERYLARQDEDAFAELLRRHGPMVLGLCERVLGDAHAAEDVFQATFLVLAQKAKSIRRPEALAAWLHGIALRLSVKARRAHCHRQVVEGQAQPATSRNPLEELTARELLQILDQELQRLPEQYQLPLLLCCVEGLSQEEAAQRLGWSAGSVKGRLERGRVRLRRRLDKLGLSLPQVLTGPLLIGATAVVSPTLAQTTTKVTLMKTVPSPTALALTKGVMATAYLSRLRTMGVVALLVMVLGVGAGLMALEFPGPSPTGYSAPAKKHTAPAAEKKNPDLQGGSLPEGAVMRLGTNERRAVDAVLSFRADGNSIVGVRAGRHISVWETQSGKLRATREVPSHSGNLATLSPDGRWLVTDDREDGKLCVWDLDTGKLSRQFSFQKIGLIRPAAFSPDGRYLAAVGNRSRDKEIWVWELATGKVIFAKQLSNLLAASDKLSFSPDGKKLLASFSSLEQGMCCWDLATGKKLWQQKEFVPPSMAITPDGKILSCIPKMPALDLATGQPLKELALPKMNWKNLLRVTPDGRTLLVTHAEEMLVWDLTAGKAIRTLSGIKGDIVVAPDGKTFLSNDGCLQRWDLATGKALYANNFQDGHVDEVIRVVFSANGKRVASASRDGTVRVWDATTGRPLHVWRAHRVSRGHLAGVWQSADEGGTTTLEITPDGRWLLSAGRDGLKVWDIVKGKEVQTIVPTLPSGIGNTDFFHIGLTPDGTTAFALFHITRFSEQAQPGETDKDPPKTHKLVRWEVQTGKVLDERMIHLPTPEISALSPDGKRVVSRRAIVDTRTGKEIRVLESISRERISLSGIPFRFSSDGLLLVGGMVRIRKNNGTRTLNPCGVGVWDIHTGKMIAHLWTRSWVGQVGFYPDSRFVATNDLDGIQVWDVLSEKVVHARKMPERVRSRNNSGTYAGCYAFSRDGRYLATGHPDSTILVWNVKLPAEPLEPLANDELDSLWKDLQDEDSTRAWRAVWRMVRFPQEAVRFLRPRLKPVLPAPENIVQPLLADLDSNSFRRREAAMKRLRELGVQAESALRQALQSRPSLELSKRLEALLSELNVQEPVTAPLLRDLRAVAVLERIGTLEARQVLAALARGVDSARLTQQARVTLAAIE